MAGTTEPPDQDTPQDASRPGQDGDTDFPGRTHDEVQPQQEEPDEPGQVPDEVNPDGGDWDEPDSSPIETPEPPGTPAAPD